MLFRSPAADGCGIDISAAAVEQDTANAAGLGLAARTRFLRHSWTDGLDRLGGTWDVIVSNPPYIASAEIAGLAPEVAGHDPPAAPDGGPAGLAAYSPLSPAPAGVLRPAGLTHPEVGAGQARAGVG